MKKYVYIYILAQFDGNLYRIIESLKWSLSSLMMNSSAILGRSPSLLLFILGWG